MSRLKLISVRLTDDNVQLIDTFAQRHKGYLTRSSVIDRVLTNVLRCSTDETFWRIVSEPHAFEKGYVVQMDYSREALTERANQKYD